MPPVTWHFDFVSPFSHIALHRLRELPERVEIRYRPVLFAGLLNHWGQKGPAEIASKRRYRFSAAGGVFGVPAIEADGELFWDANCLRVGAARKP